MTTITLPRATVEQALEALESVQPQNMGPLIHPAKQALRAALAQQAERVEPVAWLCPDDPDRATAIAWKAGHCVDCGKQRIPLYTAPPQRKED